MKKLIIFDCDGTLVDSEVIATKFFPRHWANYDVHFSEDEFKEKFIGSGANSQIVLDTFAKMPIHVKEEGDRLYLEEILSKIEPVKGMVELLKGIETKLCVASNSSLNYVQSVIKKTKLEEFFGMHLYSSEQVKNAKPAPDLFNHVLKAFETSPEDALVIEDSPSGIHAAHNANIAVIGFTGAGHFNEHLITRVKEAKPTWLCSSVKELKELLNE